MTAKPSSGAVQRPECCPTCRKFTYEGLWKRAEQYRDRPIYGTDLHRPMSEILTEARRALAAVRGTLTDVEFGDPGRAWAERVEPVVGLITCGLVALYSVIEEAKQVERRRLAEKHCSESNTEERHE